MAWLLAVAYTASMQTLMLYVLACGALQAQPEAPPTSTSVTTAGSSSSSSSSTSTDGTTTGTTTGTTAGTTTPSTGTDTGLALDTAPLADTAPLVLNGTYPPRPLPPPTFAARNRDTTPRGQADLIGTPTVLWFFPLTGTPG